MNLFYSEHKELRSGWKILRLFVMVTILTLLLAVLSGPFDLPALQKYAPHVALIVGTLLELGLRRKPLRYIGWNFGDREFWKDLVVGMAWGLLSMVLVGAGMLVVTKEISPGQIGRGFTQIDWPSLLFFWLIVAIGEETSLRGYVLSTLKEGVGDRWALVLSAAIFSAIHLLNPEYYWFAFLYAFLVGIIFGGIVLKRGNLGGVIGFHFLWNLLQDEGLLNMSARGGELVYTIVLLLNLFLVYRLLPPRAQATAPKPNPPLPGNVI